MISRERTLWNRIRRRFTSSRASVYLEYAIVMPLAILLISTLIEFAAFWDAKVMANHTAWTCARIASVEAGQKAYDSGFEVNRLRTDGMKTATALLGVGLVVLLGTYLSREAADVGVAADRVRAWRQDAQRIDRLVDTRFRACYQEYRLTAADNPAHARQLLDEMPAIERAAILLTVSNADPAHAQRLVDAYEAGLKRIEASGELRRIRAYYGLDRP